MGDEVMYFCYCFNQDGRYDKPKPFDCPEDAFTFAVRRRNAFPRLLITDDLDCTVMEMTDGEVVFPTLEDMAKTRQENPTQLSNAPEPFQLDINL